MASQPREMRPRRMAVMAWRLHIEDWRRAPLSCAVASVSFLCWQVESYRNIGTVGPTARKLGHRNPVAAPSFPCGHQCGGVVSKSKKTFDADEWLRGESLELWRLINFAHGQPVATKLPPVNSIEYVRFTNLKAEMDSGRIPYTRPHPDKGIAYHRSILHRDDVWRFVCEHGDSGDWDWLRDFCQRWAAVSGEALPKLRGSGRSARSREAAKQALDALYSGRVPGKPWKRITEEVNAWLVEKGDSRVSEDTVRRAAKLR